MRRDLRLYWRALALLGALLSIIIDWPGMMVCAMPAIFLQPNATTTINTAATMQQQQQQYIDNLMAANATFHNATTTTNTNNTYRSGNDVDAVGGLQTAEDSFALNIYLNTIGNGSLKSSSYSESEQQQQQTEEQEEKQQEAEHTTEESPKSSQARNAATLAGVNANSKRSTGDESEHHESANYAPAQYNPQTSSDDQLHNAQRIKVLNLISNKRKRKKFSGQDDDDEEAALEAIETTTTTTANNKPLSVSASSISNNNNNNNLIDNNINNNNNNQNDFKNYENQQMAVGPKRTLNQLENTTPNNINNNNINNYNNNNNNYINYIEEQVPATIDEDYESAADAEVTEPSPLFTTTSSAGNDYDDQNERSSSRSSISYTLTTLTPDKGADLLQNPAPQLPAFKFASAQHTAILLSRTERSVRQAAAPSAAQTDKNIDVRARAPSVPNRRAIRHHGGGGATNNNGGIVRRSSDGSPKSRRLNNFRNINSSRHLMPSNLDRNERSTISHLSGLSRKIQIYIKNRFIQLLPDGTVNGTQDDQSDYTILQRSTVDVGRIKIQGVATCLYLCMDACGAVYGSKEFTDDCVFNENMEQHNYNTYSSTFNSNARRVYYLALNRHGEPRKLQIPSTRSLGKLATYTNAITETVEEERVEQLIAKNFGENRIKHGLRQLCDTGKPLIELIDSKHFKALPKCNPNSSNSNSGSNSSNSNSSSSKKSISSGSGSGSGSESSSSSSTSGNSSPVGNNDSDSPSGSSSIISRQSMNNVPAANERGESQSSAVTNSHSNHQQKGGSSISNSSTVGGSGSGSQSTVVGHQNHHGGGGKKKKKRRKCRPHENEEEHNCQRSPLALRKRGNNLNNKKCREQLALQQQQRRQLKAKGDEVPHMPLPAPCKKKKNGVGGGSGGGGKKNRNNQNQNTSNRNGLGGEAAAPNNRRGKKLNANGRQAGGAGNRNVGANRKKGRNGGAQVQKKLKKQPIAKITGTTASTTKATSSSTLTTMASTTTARQEMDSTTVAAAMSITSTTTEMSNAEVDDSLDPRAEVTSARGEREREQRNVRYTNSMENDGAQVGAVAADIIGSREDSTEADVSEEEAEHEEGNVSGASEEEEDNEDASDDMYDESEESSAAVPPSSSAAATVATSGGRASATRAQLLGDADDFLYYDQFDL